MKLRVYAGLMLALSLLLVAGAWNGARAAVWWVRAPAQAVDAGRPVAKDRPIRARPGSALHEIARAERAVVFVFSPGCAVSRANMGNWTEIVRRTHGGDVALFAVGPVRPDSAAAYWGGLGRHVRVLTATAEEIDRALGVRATPLTLTVTAGRIRSESPGPLRSAARRDVLAFALGAETCRGATSGSFTLPSHRLHQR